MINSLERIVLAVVLILFCIGTVSTTEATQGKALYEYWLGIPGAQVSDLTNSPDYPDNPTGVNRYSNMQGPREFADQYGAKFSAYIVAPVSGIYNFWIATDDAGELQFSMTGEPEHAEQIATVDGYVAQNEFDVQANQKSADITLVAGEVYYIMGLVKDDGGDDHISIAWAYPDQERVFIGGDAIFDAHPKKASNPVPADGSEGIEIIGTTLSWDGPIDGFVVDPAFDVYIGTDSENPGTKLLDNSTETSVSAGTLDYETVYFWRVDVHDPNDGSPTIRKGETWQLTTKAEVPVITSDPADQLVFAGDTATFMVVADSPIAMTYNWAKTSDPNVVVGSGDTLTITDAQIADEDGYFCTVSNAKGSATSAAGILTIKRMSAHWPLDDNYEDVVGDNDGSAVGAPTFEVTDLMGDGDGAISLEGTESYVAIPFASSLNTENFTALVWCNVKGGTAHRAPISNRYDNPQRGWILYADPSNQWQYWTGTGQQVGWQNLADGNVVNDAWILLGISFEKTEAIGDGRLVGIKRFFVNGEEVNMNANETYLPNGESQFQIGAGANENPASFFFNGLINDVKMYNYPLSAAEMAGKYIDVYPDAIICAGNPDTDLNGDCKVDLADLMQLVSDWLECNLVPDCL